MKLLLTRFTTIIITALFFVSCTKNSVQPLVPISPAEPVYNGKVIKNIVYANAVNWLGQNEALGLDIYLPTTEITSSKFPLIVFFHGGGYVTGTKETVKDQCEILAGKGFTVASVDYRIGWTQDTADQCLSNETEALEAFYRAQQDARASLRFLVANADQYSIDANWIFVAGQSAGAGISLALAYQNQDTINHYLPNVADKLGLLNTTGNSLRNTYSIKGIASLWGGLEFSDDIVTSANATPTIFFHGMLDQVVPWNVGHVYGCANFPIDYGSKAIYDKLVSYAVPTVAHIDPNGGHGIYDVRFNMENVACFFESLMGKLPQTGYYTTQVSNCN